ncbi:unnamed protein product, partial [Brassica oleracea]
RDHLFFACPYSYTVWTMLLSRFLGSRINPDRTRTIDSLRSIDLLDLEGEKRATSSSSSKLLKKYRTDFGHYTKGIQKVMKLKV